MRIYADNAATTKMSPAAIAAMVRSMEEEYGNPSSLYALGQRAKEDLERSRGEIAALIGAKPGEVYFTSGGSESDTWAILCVPSVHCVTTAIEHHAAMNAFAALEKRGIRVDWVPPGRDGAVKAADVLDRVGPETGLVSVMTANNETGVIQPVKEIGEKLRERGVPFHTDAVQALGQIPVDVDSLGCSLLSASAHKFGGPKGIGILYVRKGTGIGNLIHGGLQQRGLRPGTENPAGCVGMAAALEEAVDEMEDAGNRIRGMRDTLIRLVRERVPDAILNGRAGDRLFCNANIRFPGTDGSALLMRLDMEGIAASAGSACTAGVVETSHVLTAMGLNEKEASESLRFTLGRENTPEEILRTADIISRIVNEMRA